MKYKVLTVLFIILATTLAVASHSLPASSHTPLPRNTIDSELDQNVNTQMEKKIEERDKGLNGIQVGEPKVYDDSLLQQMLNSAQARLAAIQLLDQSGVVAKIGAVTGASQQISSFGLNVQGP